MQIFIPLLCLVSAPGFQQSSFNATVPSATIEIRDTPAQYFWNDYDGDGRTDVLVLSSRSGGTLFRNEGNGKYVDVTLASGLFANADEAFQAAFGDFDGDGLTDLFLASYSGESTLLRQTANGTFADVTLSAGLPALTRVIESHWANSDDAIGLDLHVVTLAGERFFHFSFSQFKEIQLTNSAARALPAEPQASPRSVREARTAAGLPAAPSTSNVTAANNTADCASLFRCTPHGMLYTVPLLPRSGIVFPDGTVLDSATGLQGPIGPQGLTGATGPAGPIGAAGQAGSAGIQGAPGPAGTQGIQGAAGAAGPQGATGFQGDPGNAGPIGPIGPIGSAGPTGAAGTQGIQGAAGPAGAQGEAGPSGEAGAMGTAGLPGAQGIQGVQGDPGGMGPVGPTGLTGPSGPAGTIGAQGLQGIQGNQGTTGETGPLGATGAQGAQGIQGATGPLGLQGATGDPGTQGPQGPEGPQGEIGLSGPQGGAGAIGPAGPQGNLGAAGQTGNPGPQGTIGPTGEIGPAGPQGTTGLTGALGSTGPGGPQGLQGDPGSIGSTGPTGPMGSAGPTGPAGTSAWLDSTSTTTTNLLVGIGVVTPNAPLDVSSATNTRVIRAVGTARGSIAVFASAATAIRAEGINTGIVGVGNVNAVVALGNFTATGSKSFAQPHPLDPSKAIRFVCLEGNEAGTYFRGTAQLVGGIARIPVPAEFALTTDALKLTVQVTPRGPVLLWTERPNLTELVVHGDKDIEFDYFVNGVRAGFASTEIVVDNTYFRPKYRNVPFGEQYPDELRQIMVANGILNADFTPNEATAARLGWILEDSPHVRGGQQLPLAETTAIVQR